MSKEERISVLRGRYKKMGYIIEEKSDMIIAIKGVKYVILARF